MNAFLSFLVTLPELLRLVASILNCIERLGGEAFIRHLNEAFQKSAQARTPEEIDEAVKDIARSVGTDHSGS